MVFKELNKEIGIIYLQFFATQEDIFATGWCVTLFMRLPVASNMYSMGLMSGDYAKQSIRCITLLSRTQSTDPAQRQRPNHP